MRLTNLGLGLCVLGAGCQGPAAPADRPGLGEPQTPAVAEAAGPVSVETFNQRMPVGYLGHPLGTVVRVTGACVDGKTLGAKLYDGKILLRVEAVNGRKLAETVDFVFDRAGDGVSEPKPGERFDYSVHEYGGFDGTVRLPKELNPSGNVIGLAAPRFHYSSDLVVHKSHPVK